jgi:hypothetical protein
VPELIVQNTSFTQRKNRDDGNAALNYGSCNVEKSCHTVLMRPLAIKSICFLAISMSAATFFLDSSPG